MVKTAFKRLVHWHRIP